MQRTRTEILPGVWLTALRTEKFKTAWLSVDLLTQLQRETAACTAVLPYVLRHGCTRLPDPEAIAAELDALGGARITPVVRKHGEIQSIGFDAEFPDDAALGADVFPRLAADVADLLLHPNTRGGLLRPDIVECEREQLLARIRAAANDARTYARERLYAHMCCCEDFAVPRLGEESGAEHIHYRKLTMRYHDVLATSPVEIFYCGSLEGKRAARILTDALATMPRAELDEDIGTDIRMNALEEQTRYVTETLPGAQTQLAVGYRLGACMEDPDLPALFVFNALYGGCATSKLFLSLHERLGLCSCIDSQLDTHKGLLTVTGSIDADDHERVLAEITAQLDAVRSGAFTDEELHCAIRSAAGDLRAMADAPGALAGYWFRHTIQGLDIDPFEMAALVEEVTRGDVTAAAADIVCDCVYLLKGTEESSDDE